MKSITSETRPKAVCMIALAFLPFHPSCNGCGVDPASTMGIITMP